MTSLNPLIERMLPQYRERHLFAVKLRLMAFIGFWAIYLYFLRDVIGQTKAISAIIIVSFIITGIAYFNIMRGRALLISFLLELLSDLTAITAVIYLTDGPHSPYFSMYFFYALIAGILYNYYLAAAVSVFATTFYGAFLLLCHMGIIPPLILNYGGRLPIPTYTPLAHFFFVFIFLCGVVYTVKVASFFSQHRERMLERQNRWLSALHKMGSTFRSAVSLRLVIENLLAGVIEGLSFETAILMEFDWENKHVAIHVPARTERLKLIEKKLGKSIDGMEIPIEAISESAMQDILKHRIIFRKSLSELTAGLEHFISPLEGEMIQKILGVKRLVIMPIVAGNETLGVVVGFSQNVYIGEREVSTMEAFANQSALLLEAALLIDRLKRVNQELLEANQVKSMFLATMSHELRTPLTAIIGFSELLMEGVMGELNDEQKDSLKEVLHNAADLLELINSLLDLTKIESGKMRLDRRFFDLKETLRRICGTVSPLIHKKGQTLSLDVPEKLPTVFGDEKKIQQTLLNLIANANKFTPNGGTINIVISIFPDLDAVRLDSGLWDKISDIEPHLKDGALRIVVADNGIGISPDQYERVFEMFHQVDSSTTRSFGGTGVGLSLAKKFVEMHGGKIWVASELEKGATFTVVIPLTEEGISI